MKPPSRAVIVTVAALLAASCGRVSPSTPTDPPLPPIAAADATGQVVSIASAAGGISDVVISGGADATHALTREDSLRST